MNKQKYNEMEADNSESCSVCESDQAVDGHHYCQDCEDDITKEECEEYGGLCYLCMWLLDK